MVLMGSMIETDGYTRNNPYCYLIGASVGRIVTLPTVYWLRSRYCHSYNGPEGKNNTARLTFFPMSFFSLRFNLPLNRSLINDCYWGIEGHGNSSQTNKLMQDVQFIRTAQGTAPLCWFWRRWFDTDCSLVGLWLVAAKACTLVSLQISWLFFLSVYVALMAVLLVGSNTLHTLVQTYCC